MEPEFTRWFSIDTDGNPVRPGWYEIRYKDEEVFDAVNCTFYWSGTEWRRAPDLAITAFGNFNTFGETWRGLTAPMK